MRVTTMRMTFPTQPMIEKPITDMDWAVSQALMDRAAREEALLRRLLERWVSGLEPAAALDDNGNLVGLCDANAELGSYAPIFNPFK